MWNFSINMINVFLMDFSEQHDFLFDVISILFNVGIWYTKHASMIAGKDE